MSKRDLGVYIGIFFFLGIMSVVTWYGVYLFPSIPMAKRTWPFVILLFVFAACVRAIEAFLKKK